MLLVDDATMLEAMRLSLDELGLVLEPSGAASLAAVLTHHSRFEGQLVGAILTGGYVTAEQMQRWLAPSGPIYHYCQPSVLRGRPASSTMPRPCDTPGTARPRSGAPSASTDPAGYRPVSTPCAPRSR